MISPFKTKAIIVAACLLAACRKDVPQGTLISATGYVIDTVVQQRVPDAVVYLFGISHTSFPPGSSVSQNPIDSVTADGQGNFTLSYRAGGNYFDYALSLSGSAYEMITPHTRVIPGDFFPLHYFDQSHRLDSVEMDARLLGQLQLHLSVASNPYDTIWVSIQAQGYPMALIDTISGSSVDATVQLPYVPLSQNVISYEILSSALFDSLAARRLIREERDTVQPQPGSAPVFSKTFSSAYDIPLLN